MTDESGQHPQQRRRQRRLFRSDGEADLDRPEARDVDRPAVEELRQIYFRHREALSGGQPAPLDQREIDRQRVNELYPAMRQGPDRMLDARTLGTLVDSQAATQRAALMSLVSPEERLRMLAIVVRRNSFPVVQLARPATLQLSPLLARTVERVRLDADSLADAAAAAGADAPPLPASAPDAVRVRAIDPAAMAAARTGMAERLRAGLTGAEVAALSDHDAQVLSVLGSDPATRLVTLPDGGLRMEALSAADAGLGASDTPDQPAHASAGHRPRSLCINFPGQPDPPAGGRGGKPAPAPAPKRKGGR